MGKTAFLIFTAVAIVIWVGATLIAVRKHKMFAIATFFTIPSVLVFALLLIYILMLSMGYNLLQEEKKTHKLSVTIVNEDR